MSSTHSIRTTHLLQAEEEHILQVEYQGMGTAFPSGSRSDDRADRCRGKEEGEDTMDEQKNEE